LVKTAGSDHLGPVSGVGARAAGVSGIGSEETVVLLDRTRLRDNVFRNEVFILSGNANDGDTTDFRTLL